MILQNLYHESWKQKAKTLPFLLVYNAGLSVNNTVAVFDAIVGKKNIFHRTPKYGVLKTKDDWKENAYNLPFTKVTLLEMFFAVYGGGGHDGGPCYKAIPSLCRSSPYRRLGTFM